MRPTVHPRLPTVAALAPHPLFGGPTLQSTVHPRLPTVAALAPHPLFGGPTLQSTDHPFRPPTVAALASHPLLKSPEQPLPYSDPPSSTLTPTATVVEERSPFPRMLPEIAHVTRSARRKMAAPRRLEPSSLPNRQMVISRRRPLPPSPDSRSLARTPDVYVAASLLNRNATAKQRGRRGFKEPVVDAGWGLFLARDMKKNAVVLDYRFVDGREGVEVDRLDADQLKERYPDPLRPATHVLQLWGSSFYWDTLRCSGVGGFANSCVGQQNCLFRGSKIHVGKKGCSAGTEVLVSYSSSKSYQWARDPAATDDFYAQRSTLTPARSGSKRLPWSNSHWFPREKGSTTPSSPPWATTQSSQPPSPSANPPQPPPAHQTRPARDPPATLRRPSLSPLVECEEAEPPFRPPTEADLESIPTLSVVAAVLPTASPSTGVVCFQRSLPGALSPEILVHVTFDAVSNRGAGTTSFSGLPLGPPSANGWSARGVTNSLRNYVAVTPRVRQRIHQAVDRNPWGQASEVVDPLSAMLDRKSVAVWVINLTPSAACDLLDWKDTVELETDCRWIPSTTALAVDARGGLLRAQRVAALRTPVRTPVKAAELSSARRRTKSSRAYRGGRAPFDQAMKLHGYDSSYYRTVGHVYPAAPAPKIAAPHLSTAIPSSPPSVTPAATPAEPSAETSVVSPTVPPAAAAVMPSVAASLAPSAMPSDVPPAASTTMPVVVAPVVSSTVPSDVPPAVPSAAFPATPTDAPSARPPAIPSSVPFERWGSPSNHGKRGCGNICPTAGASHSASGANSAPTRPAPCSTNAGPPPPTPPPPPFSHNCMRRHPPAETPPPLSYRTPLVPLPHLVAPPLAIHRWHARMASAPPPPMVPNTAVLAALVVEQRTAELFASTTPMSPAPTIVDILKEAGRRARSRGAAQVTPLDVRHAAQLFAPPRASLVPPKPFVDPQPEHIEDLPDLFEAVHAAVDASDHRPPRVLSVGDATGIVANAFRRTGCDVVTIDRLPSEDPTMPHIIGDASDFIDAGFDLVIGQPPCTFLCNAGVVWLHRDPNRFHDMHRGAKFFRLLLDADAPFVALENPAMHRHATAAIGGLRPSQYIHPFEHGHGETKSIGIYADGLPRLLATKLVEGRAHLRAALPQSPQRSAIRGRTYIGVAAAMAIQWTPTLAQHVATQRTGIRSSNDTRSAFDLCLAVASRLGRALTVRPEHVDPEGILRAVSITVPEEHDDTDADIAAAALTAADAKASSPCKPEWVCKHGRSHPLRAAKDGHRHSSDCPEFPCVQLAAHVRLMAKTPRPTLVARETVHTIVGKPKPLATSRVAAISPVQRRPLPSETPTDTRIRRLHLRKNAWWAWAPKHDPADDHLYDWLRLDNNLQQMLSSSLSSLEVPPVLAEEDPPEVVANPLAPPYAKAGKKTLDGAVGIGVIAAMRPSAAAASDRRLFRPRPASATPDSTLAGWRKLQSEDASVGAAARDALFQSDPLCMQAFEQCITCGATRTYAPKGKVLIPHCEYASEVTHECRRGVGADACGHAQALGGTVSERRLCAPLAAMTAEQRRSNPFISFTPAVSDTDATSVARVASMSAPPPRITPMRVVLHMQRQCRHRIIRRHQAACALQQCFRSRRMLRATAAIVLQRRARSKRPPAFTALADVTLPTSRPNLKLDACSMRAVPGGYQRVASLATASRTPAPSAWRPLSAGDLDPLLTLSNSRSPSRAASLAGSDPEFTFGEEDITGDAESPNPLAYCAYLKNVRIAQTWEDGKRHRYRVNSACCWIRSTIADPGAGPSVIGQRLLHALPPDAVVRHRPCAPRISPVVGPGGERLLMLGTVSIVFTVEGRPYTHRFEIVEGGDLFILGNDFLAQHEAGVVPHLAADPTPGFVTLKHKWGTFQAELINDPNRRQLSNSPAASLRPPIAATAGAALAVLAFITMSGVPPHASDARQEAVSSGMPFHVAEPITPSDFGLSARGGVGDIEVQAPVVASVSGHPTAGFSVQDTEAAAKSLAGPKPSADPTPAHPPGSLPPDIVTEHDPALSAAMPEDDTTPAEVEDDDGLEHPPDNAPFVAPPPNYRFSPWEELKTHGNLLYSEKPVEVKGRTMKTIRLRVPIRLESFTGPVEISPCSIRHRLDHGLIIARTIGYVDPIDHTVPVQISNFNHPTRSIGSLIPICQISFETIIVHDRRSSPSDTSWDRLPPKTRRALEKVSIDESNVLTPERKARAMDLVARRHAAFSTDSKVPGATHLLEVAVDLKPGALPFRHAPSRTGTAGEKIIEEAVNDMEKHGIIRKSTSQWASRVVLVSKKSSPDPRFCVDLRDLNSRLVVLDTPLPRCDDAIDRLGIASERRPDARTAPPGGPEPPGTPALPGDPAQPADSTSPGLAGTTGTDAIDAAPRALKMLSKNLLYHTLDLTAGFWNLPVKESHRERLAFVTSKGKWEFNVLPFGLMTGPSYMQRMIEATLVGLNWELCLPYLDDVIIWANGDTEEEAFEQSMERLDLVLERLEWANLRAKPSKCHLFATSVDYLGHICSRDGVSLDPKKISAVSNINPRSINNLETVRSFLGLAGYYRNHIENFHVLSSPLVDLTKAGVDVPTESQKPEAQAAISNLIKALCSNPVLMYPRSDREFIVATDAATGVGVGACLKQVDDDGTERVVSYHGRRFNSAERNYTVTECELLAVIEAVKHFRPYLWGRRFRLVTDHMALKWLHTMKETVAGGLSSRLTRWTLRLQEHDFEVEHKPGKDHGDADGVSRLVSDDEDATGPTSTDETTSDAIKEVRTILADAVTHSANTGGDPLLTQRHVAAAITTAVFGIDSDSSFAFGSSADQVNPTGASVVAAVAPTGTPPPSSSTALRDAVQSEFLKSNFPDSEAIRLAQLADPLCAGLLTALVTGTVPDSDLSKRVRYSLPQAVIHQGLLHRQVDISGRPHQLLWIPESLRSDVVRAFHDQCNHRGREATYQAMRRVVYWPKMFDEVADHVLRCHECSFAKRPNRRQGRSFTPDVGTYPFDCLVCDVLDMSSHIGATARGNTKLVVFADSLSRWVEAIPVKGEPTSEEVLDLFTHHIFPRYGLPRTVRCDGGSNLGSMLVKAVYECSQIELAEATAHHHESAGLVERFNDTLCGMVRASTDKATAWDELLPFCLFAYRSTPHRVTNESPAYLLYGRELRGPHHVGLLDATPPTPEAGRLDKEGRLYYERYVARMRVAWNLAYHATRRQQDSDRQDRDRSADTSPSFDPNDRVLLRVPKEHHTHKLSKQWEGPFRIASDGVLENGNYRLTDLKDRRRREEVSGDRLRLYLTVTDADRIQPDEFLVEGILKRRGTGRAREYKVKWRGYPIREATWEPRAPLMVRCSDMIRDFDSRSGNTVTTDVATAADPAALPVVPPAPPVAGASVQPPVLPIPAPALPVVPPAPPVAVASALLPDTSVSAPPTSAPSNNRFYRDSEYRLHSSKVAFFDPLTGELYSHVRQRGGLDLPGGHRDKDEKSAADTLLRECLSEELRVPATLASRLRKYAKRTPYVQVVPRRTAVHVVSLWLVPATPAELAGIEQTEEGRREGHSPAMRSFATFQAESPYAEALTEGLRALRFSRDLKRFTAAEEMAAEVAADSASSIPPVLDQPPPPPTPDAAKYERGHWLYRLTFPSRNGFTTRWFPASRYSASELEDMAPLRKKWKDDLHLLGLPPSAVAAVVAAVTGLPTESTLNAHLLHCAFREISM